MHCDMLDQPELEPVENDLDRKILIVEDDESIATVLSIRLERQGYRTETAHSGRRGMQLARENRPHLVLLDLRLPDVDGFSVCQELDEDPETSQIPVIILSGMERPDIIRRSRQVGCSYYVRKPYDPNALLLLIERAMGESETH